MRGSKTVRLPVAFLAVVLTVCAPIGLLSTSESFAQDRPAKAKRTPAGLQVSVLYPADGILTPDQPQMVQVGVTVQPSPGTPLTKYKLLLKMLRHNGRTSR